MALALVACEHRVSCSCFASLRWWESHCARASRREGSASSQRCQSPRRGIGRVAHGLLARQRAGFLEDCIEYRVVADWWRAAATSEEAFRVPWKTISGFLEMRYCLTPQASGSHIRTRSEGDIRHRVQQVDSWPAISEAQSRSQASLSVFVRGGVGAFLYRRRPAKQQSGRQRRRRYRQYRDEPSARNHRRRCGEFGPRRRMAVDRFDDRLGAAQGSHQ